MKLLEGKVAFITGGNRGIGKGIVEAFAAQGATVIFTASKETAAALDFEKSLKAGGHNARFLAYNVADFAEVENAIKTTIAEFGRIDVLINNAGITRDNLLMRMSENDWDDVISVNLKSVFNHVKAVQPFMLKQRAGSIINLSSVVGINGNAGQTNYAASKAGIIGFSKSIAKEIGSRNIRCNVIAPGFIATDMTDKLPEDLKKEWTQKISLRRIGNVEDIANTAIFLASDLSAYITGQVLVCDGGM
ncbi:3-oxoacyl-[acyl-carrier-protein] reductase [Bacteroidales bacterium OttesenSCG-928-C03]|nr:3-oxoacyl-[acyl-carrier-protein] reductase [Bacteroidales bacterium OttesenSCG-928-E04]MDL2308767.1 3-oxoacyl-[acyl-carrier-protein] reductase [Bacteroidales bacterium OttesenSCG-928-C03]MDL2326099.1 3-oxoacyl-[acyl-carrier-protein] reductase [Bacteroidales bacterium OttesenSCG-928-A14]